MGVCRRDFLRCAFAGLPVGLVRAAVNRPKLLVLVVLGQQKADTWVSLLPQLTQNGVRKLMYQSAHFEDCRHSAHTFPATTLATLATGAWPAQHGIVADSWFENGALTPASGESLLATTLSAQVAADSTCRAYVIGMNASQTALFAGTPNARQFFPNSGGQFATLGDPPQWLTDFNAAKPIDLWKK